MITTLAVDPGIRGCGVSLFAGDALVAAAYVTNPRQRGMGPQESASAAAAVATWAIQQQGRAGLPTRLSLEYPRVYPARSQKGDPNDLLPLAGVVSAVAAYFPDAEVVTYFPRDWKGTVDPDIMISRIQAKLSMEEIRQASMPIASLAHNMWDAVGIGLKAVGRLDRTRIIYR